MSTAALSAYPDSRTPGALSLVTKLCERLESEQINYCHWKSNDVIERSANGKNDLDLLVGRADLIRFLNIVDSLNFKQAQAPVEKRLPGVMDYYGYDAESGMLVHLHVHCQLILGHDMSKNYRLPIEAAYLESVTQQGLFRLPAPEIEYIVFVIRMILKHVTWDTLLLKHGKLSSGDRLEMAYLQSNTKQDLVYEKLTGLFPFLEVGLFMKAEQALEPGSGLLLRIRTGRAFISALEGCSRRSRSHDIVLKVWRRAASLIARVMSKRPSKRQLSSGGAIIAFIGGDGAGKTSVMGEAHAFLSKHLDVKRIHLGKPPRSLGTWLVRLVLKLGSLLGLYPYIAHSIRYSLEDRADRDREFAGFPCLIREVCTARDRYLLYRKAFRFSASGGLVLSDRFPLEQIRLMDGLTVEQLAGNRQSHWAVKRLVSIEESYYKRIRVPDSLIVLKVDPDIAVSRKTDEDEVFVRVRSNEIWVMNWQRTSAQVVDTSRPLDEVLSKIKGLIWSSL